MRNSPEPSVHRQRERQFVEHVERLLTDERLRVDTTKGRRPVTTFQADVVKTDNAVALKRAMADAGKPDRDLEQQMPVGETIEVTLSQRKMLVMKEVVGRIKVICVSPTRELLGGAECAPMNKGGVEKILGLTPPALQGVHSTVVIFSTSGFTIEAHELAERRADRTLILVEPNDAGGFAVWGPVETKAVTDLFDPEQDEQKRGRVRSAVEEARADLSGSGVASDKLVARTALPIQYVEAELKAYAKEQPGLVAKRLDGRVVLFREGSVPPAASGGSDMPMIDRLKALFGRKGEHERKIAFLSERRAALGQQRDRAYEDNEAAERKEVELKKQFKEAGSELAKRRVTGQLLQLRKDTERRHQHLSVLNQQINVVSTHLHNLELVHQGKKAQLPDSEEMASDAAAAEEMLAKLQADAELADSVAGLTSAGGMSSEEQALFEELQRESGVATATTEETVASERSRATEPAAEEPVTAPPPPRRTEPEAG